MHMRTTIDIPDGLYAEVRAKLLRNEVTLREVVIDGLRKRLAQAETPASFCLVEAAFVGQTGFAPGFSAEQLSEAIHADAETRLSGTP